MKIQNYLCLMLLFVFKNGFLTCTVTDNNEALHENITIQENTQADFIYHLRVDTSKTFNDTTFVIEIKLCEDEKYQDVCRCRWLTEDNILCTNHKNVSMCEADTHEMRFSLLVKRTYSHILWELIRSTSPLVVLRNTKLTVTYLPKVRGLQVNGREVNETLVVEENQEVSVSCSFTNGNPPVTVRLVDETGNTQNSTKHGVGPLVISVGGFNCQDVWPVITCEALGSELKRSVAFLVRCRHQLSFITAEVPEVLDGGMTFVLKSYTSDIRGCMMNQAQPITTMRQVKCQISGHAPNFTLTLDFANNSWIGEGTWTLHVISEQWNSNITFHINNTTGKIV